MGAEHLDQTYMRNERRLPVWRLVVCLQSVVPDFLLQCHGFGGDASPSFHFLPLKGLLPCILMTKVMEANYKREGSRINWNLECVRAKVLVG